MAEGNVGLQSPARRVAAVGRGGAGRELGACDVPERPSVGPAAQSRASPVSPRYVEPRGRRSRPRIHTAAGERAR